MTASWVQSANSTTSDFPLENLPWCRFNGGRLGVAIGDLVLDLEATGLTSPDRIKLTGLLRYDAVRRPPEQAILRASDVRFDLPFSIGDYTDFYASIHHATNVGKLFRPDNPLLPNYEHMPIAYHGRASSVVIGGTPIKRPFGQLAAGRFGPAEQLDYELEFGAYICRGNTLGQSIPAVKAHDHLA